MCTLKFHTGWLAFMGMLLLLPVSVRGQYVIFMDPVHMAGEKDYISTTKGLISKINNSSIATSALYTSSVERIKQLERLKKDQYRALSTSYAFYKDQLRIDRFNETLTRVRTNLETGLIVIESNPRASYFFRDKMLELIMELNDAERVFQQATVVEGKNNQMTNADRNMLLFKSEDMLSEIAKKGQNMVNVGKMITLDPEKMEEIARGKNRKGRK